MGNLGMYQAVTIAMKKCGGPWKFLGLVAGVSAIAGGAITKGVEGVIKHFAKKATERQLAAEFAVIHTVHTEGTSNEGLQFEVGDQVRILAVDGDAALIEKIGDANNPYFVSAKFLGSISDYQPA